MTASLSVLPVHALDPPSDIRFPNSSWADDSDSESQEPQVTVVTSFSQVPRLPPLDARTQKRLQTLPSPTHLNALLKAAQHDRGALPDLVAWLVSLWTIWPTRRDKILSTLLLYGGGGLVREIWRDYVRSSPLGKEENMSSLMGLSSNPSVPDSY
jgi:ubiquitin-protein ligase E3 C